MPLPGESSWNKAAQYLSSIKLAQTQRWCGLDDRVIARYVAGTATEAEVNKVNEKLHGNAAFARELEVLSESIRVVNNGLQSFGVDDCVRLKRDIPELKLKRGTVGVVCSKWCSPNEAYEVEFGPFGLDEQTRALLTPEQLEIAEMKQSGDQFKS